MNYVVERAKRPVSLWLLILAGFILAMILLGGLTRLTNSGLSMVEWKVIVGTVPPMNETDWNEAFEKYKQFPEYRKLNQDMALDAFKFIFLMEYAHRLLGRLIGLVFLFPFAFFWLKGWLLPPMKRRGLILLLLGGLQGLIGWYMVKSGLVNMPRVSQYRLVLHLVTALLVYSLSLWYACQIRLRPLSHELRPLASMRGMILGLLVLIGLQITSGGFVAGLKAGFAFNTFPKMNGEWLPRALGSLSPWYVNLLENPVTVQFTHRCLALLVFLAVCFFFFSYIRELREPRLRKAFYALLACMILQVALGIATLLLLVPVSLASLHQAGAIALWSVALFLCHQSMTTQKDGTT